MKKNIIALLLVLLTIGLCVSCDASIDKELLDGSTVTLTIDTSLYYGDEPSDFQFTSTEISEASKSDFYGSPASEIFGIITDGYDAYLDLECTQPVSVSSQSFSLKVNKGTKLSDIIIYYNDPEKGLQSRPLYLEEFDDHDLSGNYFYGLYDKNRNRISKDTQIDSDITFFFQSGGGCVAQGCAITMADGTTKNVEDIVLGDEVLTWDFYSGSLVGKKVISLDKTPSMKRPVITITTDEGTIINIVDVQSFFDMDAKKYFNISNVNYKYQIGRNIMVCHDGKTIGSEKIISIVLHEETLDLYDIITEDSLNFVSDGALTIVPLLLAINPYEINDDLKYDPEKMEADRARYGLTKYEDFASYASEEAFNKLRLEELQILLGKGLITPDYLTFAITKFYQSTVGIR